MPCSDMDEMRSGYWRINRHGKMSQFSSIVSPTSKTNLGSPNYFQTVKISAVALIKMVSRRFALQLQRQTLERFVAKS